MSRVRVTQSVVVGGDGGLSSGVLLAALTVGGLFVLVPAIVAALGVVAATISAIVTGVVILGCVAIVGAVVVILGKYAIDRREIGRMRDEEETRRAEVIPRRVTMLPPGSGLPAIDAPRRAIDARHVSRRSV